jgi:hypothetical protein
MHGETVAGTSVVGLRPPERGAGDRSLRYDQIATRRRNAPVYGMKEDER